MRIGFAQINPTLGDFADNKDKILARVIEAKEKKCALVIFPECALYGYHPFDLLEYENVVKAQIKELQNLHKSIPAGIGVIVGAIIPNDKSPTRSYFNSAVLLEKGKKPRVFSKTLLPAGDVFDEGRFFDSSDVSKNYFTFKGKKFLLTICEDIWAWPYKGSAGHYSVNPIRALKKTKLDLVINMSASPWHPNKVRQREEVIRQTARHLGAPLLYVNLVGAQDELIFDGRSFLYDKKGVRRAEGLAFEEDLNVFDLETLEAWSPAAPMSADEELRRALVLGIRDFCRKTGIGRIHLGLSGGIDSALAVCLAVDALGPSNVRAFALPGPFNEARSLNLAHQLAKALGIAFESIEIEGIYKNILGQISKPLGIEGFSVVNENLQARIRGMILMAAANRYGSLLLATSNKSELATGYATLYGDLCGGLAPLGDLTKDQVYRLSRLYNKDRELIPSEIIDRPPSAELRPNQKDQDSLPPYEKLDQAVSNVVANSLTPKSETELWLMEQLKKSEFKRWQAPPILKVSTRSFGRGRRFPIAYRLKI